MKYYIADTFTLLGRHVRASLRMPIWVIVTLAQPMIFLTIYGQLFQRVVDIPGFETRSYIDFLTPGIVMLAALFGSAWGGMGLVEDIGSGILDRMLATPVNRAAILTARVLHSVITVSIQVTIIFLVALALGARHVTALGLVSMLGAAALLAAGFAALSNGLALLTRRDEPLVALLNFVGMPLAFLSSVFMSTQLMPPWIRSVASLNPVHWAVTAARASTLGGAPGAIGHSMWLLAGFVAAAAAVVGLTLQVYRTGA